MPYINKKLPGHPPIHTLVIDTYCDGKVTKTQYARDTFIPAPCDHTDERAYLYWYDKLTVEAIKDMSFDSPLDPNANRMMSGHEVFEDILTSIENKQTVEDIARFTESYKRIKERHGNSLDKLEE